MTLTGRRHSLLFDIPIALFGVTGHLGARARIVWGSDFVRP
jgi:hypothetical protein